MLLGEEDNDAIWTRDHLLRLATCYLLSFCFLAFPADPTKLDSQRVLLFPLPFV